MNRSDMTRQVLQPGTKVQIDSRGKRTESAMDGSKPNPMAAGVREFTTGLKRREKAAGLRRGGVVKKAGRRYD